MQALSRRQADLETKFLNHIVGSDGAASETSTRAPAASSQGSGTAPGRFNFQWGPSFVECK
eukprot:7934969-Pyramimonas_sp.AAC.1